MSPARSRDVSLDSLGVGPAACFARRRRRSFIRAAGVVALSLFAAVSLPGRAAEPWPVRPVTLVAPVPPGGATDKTGRLIARFLQERWKQPVVVDNKPGASSNIGSALVARAAPDGYTLLLSGGPFSINPSLFNSLPFDTLKDFVPVAQLTAFSSVLIANPQFPAKTMAEFLALARAPDKPVVYASAGSGTSQHLAMELLRAKAGLNLTHVPYKGGAPAISDLLGNHVGVMLAGMPEASPLLAGNRVRPLATTGRSRSPLLPDVPTFKELGLLDADASGWTGLHAPAGLSPALISRINADVNAALADPEVLQALKAMDVEPRPGSPDAFGSFVAAQMSDWKEAVRVSGAKAD